MGTETRFTRRDFMRLGLGTAAVAGVASLAGCSSTSTASNNASAIASAPVPETWDKEADFVVVGAGTALTGALKAAVDGATVIVLEKRDAVGGTTAFSGGEIYAPCNNVAGNDDPAAAKAYLTRIADGLATEAVIDSYIANSPAMVDFLMEQTGVDFAVSDHATDYHSEWEGATQGVRSLTPVNPDGPSSGAQFTNAEAEKIQALGGEVLLSTPAKRLVARLQDNGVPEVLGVVAESKGTEIFIKANKGVLLGTGGFDYNEDLKRQYLTFPSNYTFAIDGSDGDGLRMAQGVGCDLNLMPYGWGNVAYTVTGAEAYANHITSGGITPFGIQNQPGALFVNSAAKRFTDEAADYDSVLYSFMGQYPTGDMEFINIPAYFIFDQTANSSAMFPLYNPEAPEEWITVADTIEDLAVKLGLDPDALVATVEEFNAHAAEGKDPLFHRGESAYDQGGMGRPALCIGPLDNPPYCGCTIAPFLQGTKGGPKVNENAQVMHVTGEVIPRLYAAGNCAGCGAPGKYYAGAGGTLGPAMVFAYVAATHAQALTAWE